MTRTDDDGRPLDLQPLRRGGAHAPIVLAAILAGAVVVALAKPWAWGAPAPTPRPTPPPAARTAAPSVARSTPPRPTVAVPAATSDVLAPVVTPAPSGEGLIACLSIDAWRLLTISLVGDRLVRTWTALDPKPLDAATDVTEFARVADGAVLDVGYCAPIALLQGPATLVTTTAWTVPATGGLPRILGPLRPAYFSNSASRALYRRPPAFGSGPDEIWPAGRYAFHLVGARPLAVDLWFGMEVVDVPAPGGASQRPGG